MSRVHKLERQIDQKLRQILRSSSPDQTREPIELYRTIFDDITSRVEVMPRGKRAFLYSHVNVRLLVPGPERRRAYELVFADTGPLTRDIKLHFEANRVEFPARFRAEVELVDTLPDDAREREFEVAYSNPPAATPSPDSTRIQLKVLVGSAGTAQYQFAKRRINMGRLAEVLDAEMRIIRQNDVALKDDANTENATVSRAHAHLEYDAETGRFRLFDDGSARGTTVIREGSAIPVPQGNSKGVLLEQGDEILLGMVRILFEYAGT